MYVYRGFRLYGVGWLARDKGILFPYSLRAPSKFRGLRVSGLKGSGSLGKGLGSGLSG